MHLTFKLQSDAKYTTNVDCIHNSYYLTVFPVFILIKYFIWMVTYYN